MRCSSCGNDFDPTVVIDGKTRKLYNRRHCLICSPFKAHITRRLVMGKSTHPGMCSSCGKILTTRRRRLCSTCSSDRGRVVKEKVLQDLVGTICPFCGYGGEGKWGMMDFHHVDPATKKFGLNKKNLHKPVAELLEEAKKCILLCCRCHREIDRGLISQDRVRAVHQQLWS